jgi:hypothetical protein
MASTHSTHSTRNTPAKSRKKALSDTVAARALLHPGNGAEPKKPTASEELSEFEAAVAGPNGIETAASHSPEDTEDGALAEIEEAISDGEDDEVIEVEEINISYPVRKPLRAKKRFEFFMTHPDPSMWVKAWVVVMNLGMDEEYYLPIPSVRGELLDHLVQMEFVPCINSREKIFVWPIPCEGVTGRTNSWTKTARDAARQARGKLIKILSDTDEGKYRIFDTKGKVPLPTWPEDFNRKTMLARMFKDHVLRDLDNDVSREILNAGKKIEK